MIFNCCSFELVLGVKTYGCFEPGVNNVYYRFVYSSPVGPEDEGYDNVRCWAKGLPMLTLDLRKRYVIQDPSCILHRTPIYVVNIWQFENRSIQFRNGQGHIFGSKMFWGKDLATDADPIVLPEEYFPVNAFLSLRTSTFANNAQMSISQFQLTGMFVLLCFYFLPSHFIYDFFLFLLFY